MDLVGGGGAARIGLKRVAEKSGELCALPDPFCLESGSPAAVPSSEDLVMESGEIIGGRQVGGAGEGSSWFGSESSLDNSSTTSDGNTPTRPLNSPIQNPSSIPSSSLRII